MVSVKICGLQTEEMAEQVARLPVDYIGFVFARSKRQVTLGQAKAMLRMIQTARHRPQAVGVFVNPSLEELDTVLREAALDVIQLHGQESPEFCLTVKKSFPGVKVFKVIAISAAMSSENSMESVRDHLEPYRGSADGMLLDTFDPVYGGGSGKTFAWETIPPYQQWCREAGIPLLVAGGLQPDNVQKLIEDYAPDGVDVSSGVEIDGVKDIAKITTFVERVKSFV